MSDLPIPTLQYSFSADFIKSLPPPLELKRSDCLYITRSTDSVCSACNAYGACDTSVTNKPIPV